MRTALAPHLDEFVLCRGWIQIWKEIDDLSTRQVVVAQPTIKKADRDLLYKDQEVISTEHHLNLFIKHEDLPNYEIIFERNSPIHFTGIVEKYIRSNGSEDYGIFANKQSTLVYEIEKLIKGTDEAYNSTSIEEFEKSIDYLTNYAIPTTTDLILRLEECGNMLPTFKKTFKQYVAELAELFYDLPKLLNQYENLISSREYRRSKKKKSSNLSVVSQMKDTKKKSNKELNELKTRLLKGFTND